MAFVAEKKDKNEKGTDFPGIEGALGGGDVITKTQTSGAMGSGGTSGDFQTTAQQNQSMTAPSAAAFEANKGKMSDTREKVFGDVSKQLGQETSELASEQQSFLKQSELKQPDFAGIAQGVAGGNQESIQQAQKMLTGAPEPMVDQPQFSEVESDTLSNIARGDLSAFTPERSGRFTSGMKAFDQSILRSDPQFRQSLQEAQTRQDALEKRRLDATVQTRQAAAEGRREDFERQRDVLRQSLTQELAAIRDPAARQMQAYNAAIDLYEKDTPERRAAFQSAYESAISELPDDLKQFAPSIEDAITKNYFPEIEVASDLSLGAFIGGEDRAAYENLAALLGEDPLAQAYQADRGPAYTFGDGFSDTLYDIARQGYVDSLQDSFVEPGYIAPTGQTNPIDLSGAVAEQQRLEDERKMTRAEEIAAAQRPGNDKGDFAVDSTPERLREDVSEALRIDEAGDYLGRLAKNLLPEYLR